MPVIVDQHMRERITHEAALFPISYFENELSELPNWEGPLHWHPDFEIARAEIAALDYQVGQKHILLQPGDSLLVNGNLLHGVRQIAGDMPDPLPAIVFSGTLIAPETSTIYQKYIAPIGDCGSLPFIVFRRQDDWCGEIHCLLDEIFTCLKQRTGCYEMVVQRGLNRLLECLFRRFDALPKSQATRIQLRTQVRVQKMLSYIYTHYAEPITFTDIAEAASISRSEAARCFHEYMDCSPVNALIRYRLQTAHRLLHDASLTVQEISAACGFRSANYFGRQFRQIYGYTPGHVRSLER
ncbi:helix-turn-helix domain-containing protein [Pseudoflavonifractor sp. CLA-AP-H29]|uniref:Helix-turn-helix domain-containing protein n=1 Tax=Pseudoflavonifractor intestinihominis TaxID=3133171 RepID=A0ABV1E9D4_9FIRM